MKKKFPFKKSLTRILSLGALMAIATHCTKEPQPNPNHGSGQNKEKIIIWDWFYDGLPNRDTVKYYAEHPDYTRVVLMPDPDSEQSNAATRVYRTWYYHRAHDSLQKYINFNKNTVTGGGVIRVNKINGAQLPPDYEPETSLSGMSLEDSIWYAGNGWRIVRGDAELTPTILFFDALNMMRTNER